MSDKNFLNPDELDHEYALRMLAKGYAIEDIADITGLTPNVINLLAQKAEHERRRLIASEPYAVLTKDNTILTFYYDNRKKSRNGYDVGPFSYSDKRWGGHSSEIVTVVFDESFANCNTLTSTAFWFDGCKNLTNITGITNLLTSKVTKMDRMFAGCYSLEKLNVSGFKTGNVTDMNDMFEGCLGLKSLDLNNFKTGKVTKMSSMFHGCSGLKSLNLSGFRTDKVTDMSYMFYGCSCLKSLDLSGFRTDKVTDMSYMFYGCSSMKTLNLSGFETDNVSSMSYMFYNCSELTTVDLSGFTSGRVKDLRWMFAGCSKMEDIDMNGFTTGNVKCLRGMFYDCQSLTSLNLSQFCTDDVIDMSDMFCGCSNLQNLDLSGVKTDNVIGMREMFFGCSCLKSLDLSGFRTDNVTNMNYMFYGCSGLKNLDLSGFRTDNVKNMECMFHGCSGLKSLNLSGFRTDNVTDMCYMFYGCHELKRISVTKLWNVSEVKNSNSMFEGCTKLTGGNGTLYSAKHTDCDYATIDSKNQPGYFTKQTMPLEPYAVLSENNTILTFFYDNQKEERNGLSIGPFYLDLFNESLVDSNNMRYITDSEFFFSRQHNTEYQEPWGGYSGNITTVTFDDTFANCNTITSTAFWFDGCKNLTSIIGIRNLNTVNVTTMRGMFRDCSSLKTLDISGLRTDKVMFMASMFSGCSGLTSVNLSGVRTGKVTCMSAMFSGCSGLTSLDLSEFSTDQVEDMKSMFRGCSGLRSLDLSGFRTDNLTDISYMFQGCSSLKRIYVERGCDLSKCHGEDVFEGCVSIMGGNYTVYNGNHTGSSYACIDNSDASGYFTDKDKYMKNIDTEPYAALSDNNSVLTFYYDKQKWDRNGFNIGPFTYGVEHWGGHSGEITTVIFDDSFANCRTIKSTAFWFNRCMKLTTIIGIENLLTGKVTKMYSMFYGCSSLTNLDLSSLNTENVTDMSYMFYRCTELTRLDLGGFNTIKVKDMTSMFGGCPMLKSIYVGKKWSVLQLDHSNNMLAGCTMITGGNGTKYDAEQTDLTYAHIDNEDDPGYFTLKKRLSRNR